MQDIPEFGAGSLLKMLKKVEGTVSQPESYRSIALELEVFKLLMRLLTQRTEQKTDPLLPDEQLRF